MAAKTTKPRSPRYRDIATKLQKDIRLGKAEVGNLLPTETELMAKYSASKCRYSCRFLDRARLVC